MLHQKHGESNQHNIDLKIRKLGKEKEGKNKRMNEEKKEWKEGGMEEKFGEGGKDILGHRRPLTKTENEAQK